MNIYEYFNSLKSTKEVLSKDKIKISGSTLGYNEMLIATDFYMNNKTIFVILPNLYFAQKYYDEMCTYFNEEDILFFPSDELVSAEMVSATGDFLYERIETIYELITSNKKIVIMNIHGALKYELDKKYFINSIFKLHTNDTFDIKELTDRLIKLGYIPSYQTVKTGQFSKRGSIVDIFPLGYDKPVRIDFFGDDIESIKEYDSETQRSIKKIDEIEVLPVSEMIYSDSDYKKAYERINSFMADFNLSEIEEDTFKRDLINLEAHENLGSLSRYLSFFDDDLKTIFDFVDEKKIYFIDFPRSNDCYEKMCLDLTDYCLRIGGFSFSKMKMFQNIKNIENIANVEIEGLNSIGADYNICASDVTPYKGNPKAIFDELNRLKNKKKLILSIGNKDRLNSIRNLFIENDVYPKIINDFNEAKPLMINLYNGSLPTLNLEYEGYLVINEATLFDNIEKPKKPKYKSIYKNATKISRYDELVKGDYVVHYNYGIGRYIGVITKERDGIKRDYIHVEYRNKSELDIPLEQISNLMKYASADVEGVILHEIGSTEWARTKAKVRKRVHDISDKLISIYSRRQASVGFKFPEDSPEQAEFEAEFSYELTEDQKRAVNQIKTDMESARPMDRLVCGDVGYGKTEVALRAAFKAVYGGKQVCVLAPTTILARQHYYTFKNRMEKYGIRVELLSRFVSAKKQKEVILDLHKGGVDVVIGTHRVLSNEIKYHDLGLLIIDEEQRFGVTHKEKIKELKVDVDCITLSATPIPRTLQMSMMGIKDLSMIETPPKNRYPIQTYVLERNDRIIQDAILREISRDGQVFYLYNRTETIEEVARHIYELVPEAKICVGHGKMSKADLEDVVESFIEKKYNVLICTTIIETGIDMPDTNTLIIHDADRLGLSQMYQIRGRVGRSNKIAYAYLMYEPRKRLTPEAEKRLETIKEFNELGSGYKIAMRDLSIRGSGDVLGEEQSGFVESVGIDMYLKILDEEINKKPTEEKVVDSSITKPMASRTISENYISNDDIRIKLHKKIDKLESLDDLYSLNEELIDRFGKPDEEIEAYMYEKLMKNYCNKIGIYKINTLPNKKIDFIMSEKSSKEVDGVKLFLSVHDYKGITPSLKGKEIHIYLDTIGRTKLEYFKEIVSYFSKISDTQ